MFKELAAAAKRAPIAIMIVTEGDHLRVTIQQRPDKVKDGQIPLAISVAQTPELLDAELPAAIAEACTTTQGTESVLDQVRKQATRAAESVEKKADKKKTAAAAKKKAAVKRAGKPAKEKQAADSQSQKTRPAKPTKHIASKPTKDQCIAAYHAYAAAHPDDIKREPFIKGNPTGRRFERLFGNWEKFIKAAAKAGTTGPADDKKTIPLPLEAPAAAPSTAAQAPCMTPASSSGPESIPDSANDVSPSNAAVSLNENTPDVKPAPAAATETKGRKVITAQGDVCIATGVEMLVETDTEITVPGTSAKLRVLDYDDKTIWVEHVAQQSTEGATA